MYKSYQNEEKFEKWLQKMWERKNEVRSPRIVTYRTFEDFKKVLESGLLLPIENALWGLWEIFQEIQSINDNRLKTTLIKKIDHVFERLSFFIETFRSPKENPQEPCNFSEEDVKQWLQEIRDKYPDFRYSDNVELLAEAILSMKRLSPLCLSILIRIIKKLI